MNINYSFACFGHVTTFIVLQRRTSIKGGTFTRYIDVQMPEISMQCL